MLNGAPNKMKLDHSKYSAGFTLLEVLLALLVISIGLIALVQSAQQGAITAETFQKKTAAYHVADQVMLQLYQKPDLRTGRHHGQELFAGKDYYWQADMSATDNNSINRIDLVIGLDRKLDYAEARLTGFKRSR